MDIIKCLTLSTVHIKESTAVALDKECRWTIDRMGLCVYGKHKFGWYISVPDEADLEGYSDTVPEDLMACLRLAVKHNCCLLCLDRDGEAVEGLATFEW